MRDVVRIVRIKCTGNLGKPVTYLKFMDYEKHNANVITLVSIIPAEHNSVVMMQTALKYLPIVV